MLTLERENHHGIKGIISIAHRGTRGATYAMDRVGDTNKKIGGDRNGKGDKELTSRRGRVSPR